MKIKVLLSYILLIAGILTVSGQPTAHGEWNFDDADNLTKATIGTDLVLVGSHEAVEGSETGDGAIRIGVGSYYSYTHGLSPASGETKINEYSILYDIKVPDVSSWRSLLQTDPTNSTDGELFLRNSGGTIGLSTTGYSSKAITADTWNRVVVVANNGSEYSIYLNGEKILTGTVQAVDGQFSLNTDVLFMADENGEDNNTNVSRICFYNKALTAAEVTQLGGFDIPEPPREAFLSLPYQQNASVSGITIMWETDIAQAGKLNYGKTTDLGNELSSTYINTKAGTAIQKVGISGLEPSTKYYYSAEFDGYRSDTLNFTTAPTEKDAAFTVGIWGDSHYANPFNKMAEFMVDSLKVDFGFNSGDISNSGNNHTDLEKVFIPHVCGTIGSKVPFYSAMGNHDVGSRWGGGDLVRQYHEQPTTLNSDPGYFNGSYLYIYSNVAFIAIDWNRMEQDVLPGAFLENALNRTAIQNARFRFVFIHNAPFYERWQVAENEIIQTNLPAIASKYNVDAVFSGHMHGYERGVLDGVQYITQGGGSYLDISEPIGNTYEHIIIGTNKAANPPGFADGMINHLLSLNITDNTANIKLHYFNKAGEHTGIMETVEIINTVESVQKIYSSLDVRIVNDLQMKTMTIECENDFVCEIFNIAGQAVYADISKDNNLLINTSDNRAGIYIVRVSNKDGISTKKIHFN